MKMQQDFESYNLMVDGAFEEIKHEIAQKVWKYATTIKTLKR
jgi:hypothetical protein